MGKICLFILALLVSVQGLCGNPIQVQRIYNTDGSATIKITEEYSQTTRSVFYTTFGDVKVQENGDWVETGSAKDSSASFYCIRKNGSKEDSCEFTIRPSSAAYIDQKNDCVVYRSRAAQGLWWNYTFTSDSEGVPNSLAMARVTHMAVWVVSSPYLGSGKILGPGYLVPCDGRGW